ncbi:phosphomannomutase 2 isoform X3 [Anoplolepis gracilipes]|uniref:phosphomannomutase 2 isoform X3 n=1 Tax=Anoplolepis gracilipes TaxID=354296 RepID=UPI003B9F7FA0
MSKKIICLFDVDGTLTEPRQPISSNIEKFLLETVKKEFDIAVVGGSDLNKIQEQLGEENLFEKYKYVFAENGLIAFKNGKALPSQSIQNMLGEDILQDFINFVLRYISELKLPMKRGTFVEFRTGIVNISPIGRNCSRKEREQFFEYDSEHHIREKFIQALKKEFPDLPLTYSIDDIYFFSKGDRSLLMFFLSVGIKHIACVISKDMMKYISSATKRRRAVTIMRFMRAI